ncbi:MAG: hypothetical protein JWM82_2511 [Myxococcales bacterium]|nr:hypothetical protein [Myxococcales bacterium]
MALAKKVRKGPPMASAEEGSDEEEAAESPDEAAAEGDDAPESEGYDSVEDSAVSDLMSTKDPETFKSALRDFVRSCMDRDAEGADGE